MTASPRAGTPCTALEGKEVGRRRDAPAGAVLLLLLCCETVPVPSGAPKGSEHDACPGAYRADTQRAAAVLGLLGRTEEGRALLDRAPEYAAICFGDIAIPAITTDGVVLLDAQASDGEHAARLGHLLLHASGEADEVRAHALELLLRIELGVKRPRLTLPFEQEYRRTPPERRLEVLSRHFPGKVESAPPTPRRTRAGSQPR